MPYLCPVRHLEKITLVMFWYMNCLINFTDWYLADRYLIEKEGKRFSAEAKKYSIAAQGRITLAGSSEEIRKISVESG
jgi:hypothetical protein